MPKIIKSSKLGDAAILKQNYKYFKKRKIQTGQPKQIYSRNKSLLQGNYSNAIKPNASDKKDILCGQKLLKGSGYFSFSKALFVEIMLKF